LLSLLKYLKTGKILIVVCLFLFKNNIFSQNLVQNGSFESTTNLNCLVDPYNYVNYWLPIGSPDYFNANCTSGGYKVPSNYFGISYPINGIGYVGVAVYYKTSEAKEYLQQHLISPLISGKTYYSSFYITLSDKVTYSIQNIGALFSTSQPTVTGNYYFPATPQIENHSGYLSDTVGWMKIDGYFKAQGGEEYITVGNFYSISNTDTLQVYTNDPFPSDPGTSYYYIDSVSLYDSLNYALITNIKRLEDEVKVNLYPNPNNGNFKLEYHITKEVEFVVTDITGRIVSQYTLLPTQNNFLIKEDELNAGVYFYSIKMNNSLHKNDKLIIIK